MKRNVQKGFVGILVALAATAQAANYYVDINSATPGWPYNDWTNAATDIQTAVDAASALDTIWVAEGRYTVTNTVVPPKGTNIVEVFKPLTFRASGSREATILDGQGSNRCIYVTYNIVIPNNVTTVDGFTLTNGASHKGAGIYYDLHDGADYNKRMHARIRNCVLAGNTATNGTGGGVAVTSASSTSGGFALQVSNCVFRSNISRTSIGGAIQLTSRAAGSAIYDSLFEDNQTVAATGYGGALSLDTLYESFPIERTVFRNNQSPSTMLGNSDGAGAAIWMSRVKLMPRNCLFVNNRGRQGSAIHARTRPQITLENCTIASNRVTLPASAAVHLGGDNAGSPYVRLYNNIVYNNTGGNQGGNIYIHPGLAALPVVGITNNCTKLSTLHPDTYGSGNITNKPDFVNLEGVDLHAKPTSPTVNQGYNQSWMDGAMDLDGNPRKDETIGIVDMGCYEYVFHGTSITIR